MQIKVMPLCLGMGLGMIAMKLICLKQESMEDDCPLDECKCEHNKEKSQCAVTKAKEKITQVLSEIEKLEMSDIKVKTKEALESIKEKILSIHL